MAHDRDQSGHNHHHCEILKSVCMIRFPSDASALVTVFFDGDEKDNPDYANLRRVVVADSLSAVSPTGSRRRSTTPQVATCDTADCQSALQACCQAQRSSNHFFVNPDEPNPGLSA